MKVRKNLEGLFLALAVVAITASYATAEVPSIEVAGSPAAKPVATIVADAGIATVVVKARRLTAAEKTVRV